MLRSRRLWFVLLAGLALTDASARSAPMRQDTDDITVDLREGYAVTRKSKELVHLHVLSSADLKEFRTLATGERVIKDVTINSHHALDDILSCLASKSVATLSLYKCKMTPTTVSQLGALSQLRSLMITDSHLPDEWPTNLAQIRGLKLLGIKGSQVGPDDIAALAKSRSIETFQFAACKLTKQAIQQLGNMKGATALYLENDPVEDSDLDVFLTMPKLASISLDGTKVTNSGLSKLAQKKGIELISIQKTKVDRETIEKIRKSTPTLTIVNDWSK